MKQITHKIITITLVIIIAILVGYILTPTKTIAPAQRIDSISINADEQTVLELGNDYRASKQLTKLSINSQLMKSAQAKADDLCKSGNWSHTDSQGREFYSFIQATGYKYEHAGENLAKGYATQELAFKALINSPTHLENIVGDYKEIGIGISDCNGQNYLVAHYGIQK